jgi:RNA polymerase sigma-70 factor (ECF subfamily)
MTTAALPDVFTSRPATERDRIRYAASGDPAHVLPALVVHHSDLLLAYIRRFIPDPDDARDLLQDVWLQILKKGHTYAGTGSLLGWILSIARNSCLSTLRRAERRNTLQPTTEHAADFWARQVSEASSPHRLAELSELRRDLDCAIASLAPRQREVVIMRLVEGLSTHETAAQLRCSTGTVKGTLFRAKRQLRDNLEHWRS